MIRIQEAPFSVEAEIERLVRERPVVGGVVSFLGTVRDYAGDQAVQAIELEYYPGMTESELEKIEAAARARFEVEEIAVVHRVGRLAVSESIVLVIAAARHRAAAFDACRYVIDHLKVFATFWKKEVTAAGDSLWVKSCPGCEAAQGHWDDLRGIGHDHGGHGGGAAGEGTPEPDHPHHPRTAPDGPHPGLPHVHVPDPDSAPAPAASLDHHQGRRHGHGDGHHGHHGHHGDGPHGHGPHGHGHDHSHQGHGHHHGGPAWAGLRVGILTLSDSRDLASDKSGDALEGLILGYGGTVGVREILPDDQARISALLADWADARGVEVILTTGGTGPGPRDVTPEATRAVCDKELPGFAELIRAEGLKQVRSALLTRGVSAFRGTTLIVNLPGSTRGAVHSLEAVADLIPHALRMALGGGH